MKINHKKGFSTKLMSFWNSMKKTEKNCKRSSLENYVSNKTRQHDRARLNTRQHDTTRMQHETTRDNTSKKLTNTSQHQ